MFDIIRLRSEWQRAGLNNKDIAELIDVTPQTISGYIRSTPDKCNLTASNAAKICETIQKPMDMFVMKPNNN